MMVIFILFLFAGVFTIKRNTKISIDEGHGTVSFEATNIPWGFIPEHDAFSEMNEQQVQQTYSVLDDTNTPHLHENHEFVISMLYNSTLFRELKYDKIREFLWNKKPIFLLLLCNCERDQDWGLDLFEKYIEKHKNDMNFLFAFPEVTDKYNLVSTFDIHRLPTVIIDNIPVGFNNEKFRIRQDISSYAWRDPDYAARKMSQFVFDFFEETLPLVVRSDDPHPLPFDENSNGNTWDLVGSNFKHLVMDDTEHDYLVLVYAPNCLACKAILPIFQDLAESLIDFPDIRVATFDKSQNDFPVRGLYLKVYPTVFFFPAKHKSESVNFFDFHTFHFTEEGLLSFVQKHADNSINYNQVLKVIQNKPEKQYDGDCVILNPENFDSIVKDPTKDVFVDFYAPWCAYCKMLAPTWEELCTMYNTNNEQYPNIVVAKFDCSKYESYASRTIRINSYPTLNFYSMENKKRPSRFRSQRNLQTLTNFVESHRSEKMDMGDLSEQYGKDGFAISKEEYCVLKNGDHLIDLNRVSRLDAEQDDYHVLSDDGEYDFFLQICSTTKRKCADRVGEFPIVQMSVRDPKTHCYYLGKGGSDNTKAYVLEGGEKPVSVIEYYHGERSDDFRSRKTVIRMECVLPWGDINEGEIEEDSFTFLGENHDDPSMIVYNFLLRSSKVCNK